MALCYRCCVALMSGGLALSMVGCQPEPPQRRTLPPPPPSNPLLPSSSPTQTEPVAQPVTFTLSVDRPGSDLLIKPGSFIRQGEVIVNPVARRAQLEIQQREIEAKLDSLASLQRPDVSTQLEEENIALAQKRLEAAQAALLDYQQNSPWTDFARENLPLAQEEVQLTRLQNGVKRAEINLEQARARLAEKRGAVRNFQVEQTVSQQNLQNALAQVKENIAQLKPLTSPHTGTVQKINLPLQPKAGQPIVVTVQLIPGETPIPLNPESGLPAPPSGELPTSVEGRQPSDLLPPDLNLSDPSQTPNLPGLPAPSPAPNGISEPNPVTE